MSALSWVMSYTERTNQRTPCISLQNKNEHMKVRNITKSRSSFHCVSDYTVYMAYYMCIGHDALCDGHDAKLCDGHC